MGYKCPHCLTTVSLDFGTNYLLTSHSVNWNIKYGNCPECDSFIAYLYGDPGSRGITPVQQFLVHPKGISRPPVPPEVPEDIAKDYKESCLVLPDSPNASAALARRCLQSLIRNHFKIVAKTLGEEIDALIKTGKLPPYITDELHSIRELGNIAAHPMNNEITGQIVDATPEEAEHLLVLIESLFEFCFVAPEKMKKQRESIQQKYREAEKP